MIKLPTLNYSTLTSSELDDACKKYGAFFLENHNIEEKEVCLMLESSEHFFNKSKKIKSKYFANLENSYIGYRPIGFEVAKGTNNIEKCEQYKFGFINNEDIVDRVRVNELLDTFLYQNSFKDFWGKSQMISNKLLNIMANNLTLGDNYFNQYLTKPMHQVGLNKYPKLKSSEKLYVNMSSHTDMSLFTLLIENNHGLELFFEGEYHLITPPKKNSIIVILGEYMEKWSGGEYKAVIHRVSTTSERISINYKHRPNHSAIVPASLNKGISYETGISHEQKLNEICTLSN